MLNMWVAAARHRRAGRAGHPHVAAGARPTSPFVAFSLGPLRRGGGQARARPDGRRACPSSSSTASAGRALPLMTAGLECYAYSGGPCRHSAGRPPPRGLGHHPGRRPRAPAGTCPTASGATSSSPPSTATTACCATTSRRPCDPRPSPCPCGETTIRGFWGGRFKDLLAVPGQALPGERGRGRAAHGARRSPADARVRGGEAPATTAAPLPVRVELRRRRPGRRGRPRAPAPSSATSASRPTSRSSTRDTLPRSGYKAIRLVDS